MAQHKTLFRVILSSPSDMDSERNIVRKTVSEINDTYKFSPFGLQLLSWEEDVPPSLTMHNAQLDIDSIFSYDSSDLIIGLFHTKIGSPVLNDQSGTIHEIEKAIESYKERKKPEIKLYFKRIKKKYYEATADELANYKKVQETKAKYKTLGIIQSFDSSKEFESLCRKHILQFFNEQCESYRPRSFLFDSIVNVKPRSSFERMESIVGAAKKNVFILGINLEGAINLREMLVDKARQGVAIKLLALSPYGRELEHFNINDVDTEIKRSKIITNLDILYSQTKGVPNIELRTVDNIFVSGCTAIDADTSYGRIVSQQYLFHVGTANAPILDIYADEAPTCFEAYNQYLRNLWNIAKPYMEGK